MALVVEDGSGVANADSYVSQANAKARVLALYGATDLFYLADDEEEDAFLRRAFRYLESTYRGRWKGTKGSKAQAGHFPAVGATDGAGFELDSDEIPTELVDAQIEAARLMANGVDLDGALERGGAIKREKVGPLETEYADSAPGGTDTPTLDDLVGGLLEGSGSGSQVRVARG